MRIGKRFAVLAASVTALTFAATAAEASASCAPTTVCFWSNPDYAGQKVVGYEQNDEWSGLPGTGLFFSLRNEFSNRKVLIAQRYNGSLHNIRCVPPSANRPLLNSGIDNFRVGQPGSNC